MVEKRLVGQVAVITDGESCVGKAIASKLLNEGASLAVAGQAGSNPLDVKKQFNTESSAVEVIPTDIRDEEQCNAFVKKAMERFGHLNILVNNRTSFVGGQKKVLDLAVDEWLEGYEVNLRGPFFVCCAALPYLKDQDRASIMNIVSIDARKCWPNSGIFESTKLALRAMTVVLSKELREEAPQIRVHVINPDRMRADQYGAESSSNVHDAGAVAPEEIAELVVMLAAYEGNAIMDEINMRRMDADYYCYE